MEQLKMESSQSPSSPSMPSSSTQASASNSIASSLASLVKVEGGSSVGGGPCGTGSGGCASEERECMDVAHTESTHEQDDGQLGDGQLSSSTTTDDGGEDVEGGSSHGNGGWEADGRIHPLMDQVILGHLFKFMPPRALATSRLVCQTWRDHSLSTWRSNSTVKISRLGRGNESEYYLKDEERTTLGQFMDFWAANCLIKPYRQFHLEDWRFREETAVVTVDLTRFWQMVGSQMTKLRMDGCSRSPNDLEPFVNLIIHSCPNLNTLILQDVTVDSMFPIRRNHAAENPVPNPNPAHAEHLNLKFLELIFRRRYYYNLLRVGEDYTRLLSHFPHLTSIKVSAKASQQPTEVLLLLRAVKEVRTQCPQKLPIRELATDSLELCSDQRQDDNGEEVVGQRFSPEELTRLLLELRIPAQSIRLTDNLNQIDTQNIIETCADALTELVVFRRSSPRSNFPFGLHLGNLRHLTMSEGFCKSLELLKYTPNLETLRIRDDKPVPATGRPRGMVTDLISNTFKPDLEDVKLLKLSSLTMEFVVKDDDLRWLVRWMPHVKTLQMFLDDRQFAIACENWKELEALHVFGNRLTDSGVTGMIEVKGNGNENEMMVVHPNVACLQKLEMFTAQDSILTAASLHHGFLKLDRRLRLSSGVQKAGEIEKGIAAKEALLIQQKMWINWDDE